LHRRKGLRSLPHAARKRQREEVKGPCFPAKTAAIVLGSSNGWPLIVDGKPIGYVATRDLGPVP
jgi:hypothetical protein